MGLDSAIFFFFLKPPSLSAYTTITFITIFNTNLLLYIYSLSFKTLPDLAPFLSLKALIKEPFCYFQVFTD